MYCIRHIFRESNFSQIWTSRRDRGGQQWTEKLVLFTNLHMHCVLYTTSIAYTSRIHASGSEVNIFCVLLNSWIAPTCKIHENKTPAKYMAYTVVHKELSLLLPLACTCFNLIRILHNWYCEISRLKFVVWPSHLGPILISSSLLISNLCIDLPAVWSAAEWLHVPSVLLCPVSHPVPVSQPTSQIQAVSLEALSREWLIFVKVLRGD